jgi:E3 ubiquitin-protein ligase TRIP12
MHRNDEQSPFSVLVKKLQDLLSRAEHFEVVTVHQNYDGSRSSASMLAKQLRLKLVAEEGSDIPKSYRNIMVSIHAIATFKALDDYLKPRIYISERPRGSRRDRGGLSGALAAFAAAAGLPPPGPAGLLPPSAGEGTSSNPPAPPKSGRAGRRAPARNSSGPGTGPSTSTPRTPARGENSHGSEQLECMDERPMPDDDDMDDMDAVLDNLERDMEDEPESTGPVNMEVAGGKVTARKEDGTRVATPLSVVQSGSSAVSPKPNTKISYAAAAASSINDWHIEFSISGHTISNDMTIYKAVQLNRNVTTDEPTYRNIWSAVHPVTFRRVPGAAPPDGPLSPGADNSQPISTVPASLDKNRITSSILQLLSILHALNANIDDVFQDMEVGKPQAQPLSQFVNTKLTAKLNRQLEEPLIVASACLPSWSEDLSRFYPFLFPFETRHLYLQSTSFGYSRSMTRWQNSQQSSDSRQDRHRDDNRPFLGRLQRQKVRISRERILESAIKVMEIYGASPSVLEVEYFEEVGTGLGPTLEFYSTVSRAFVGKKLKLWRENDSHDNNEYVFGRQGLFPAPMSEKMVNSDNGKKLLHLFTILGKFVARSMLDSRIIDIYFNSTFFRTGDNCDKAVPPSLGAVKSVDKDLAKSLKLLRKFALAKKKVDDNQVLTPRGKQERYKEISFDGVRVEDLEIDFTLPGYPDIELVLNGAEVKVTIYNVGEYVDKVIDMTLGSGVRRQVEAFRAGFSQVFPYNALRSFTPDELVMLFGQVEEDWTLESKLLSLSRCGLNLADKFAELMDSMKADHGFNMDSKTIRNLLQAMSEYNTTERREFLQFVTGSPKLPIGGQYPRCMNFFSC